MTANDRKFLIFFMDGQFYAFDLALIAEVMDPATSWPIPIAPPCYSGAINFHGAIVAVLDLAVFFGVASCIKPEKIIVLDLNAASLGFLVERVTRIVREQETELLEAPPVRFALASLCLPEGNATLLDINGIIKAAEVAISG